MKKIYFYLMAITSLCYSQQSQADHLRDHLLFGGKLEGSQETPPVTTSATGVASLVLNSTRDTMFVTVSVAGLSGPITGVHIHEGLPGVAGPIVVNLMPYLSGNKIMAALTGPDLPPAAIAKYLNGLYYVNVHTAANPNGEIRGQIILETEVGFSVRLNGAQETPAVTTTASGTGFVMLSNDLKKLKFMVVFEGLSGTPTMAHFHNGAVGVAGPIVSTLTTFINGNVMSGEVDPSTFLIPLILGNIYINIHTAANPNGEIRGQVKIERGILMDAQLNGAQETPPVTTNAQGVAGVRLNPTLDSLEFWSQVTGLSGPITMAHFHNGAVGVAGPIIINLMPYISGNKISGKISLAGVPAPTINQFLRGEMYLNVHTAANPAGEIRGQVYRLAREGYTFAMNGRQETPPVTSTSGFGSGFVSVDRDQTNAHFMMVWSGLSGPVTMAHFHRGLPGVAGPIVFDLMPFFNTPTNPSGAFGYWNSTSTPPFTTRNSVQFRSDSLYVNVHTANFPAGEIRGQVIRGAKSLKRLLSITPDAEGTTFIAYPNPSAQQFWVKLTSAIPQTGTLKVTDVVGRLVFEKEFALHPGQNETLLELAKPGMYQVEFISPESHLTNRIVKF